MKKILCLTIDDINISKMGEHLDVTCSDGTVINLSPEACKELVLSITEILSKEENNINNDSTIWLHKDSNIPAKVHKDLIELYLTKYKAQSVYVLPCECVSLTGQELEEIYQAYKSLQ